MKRVILSLMIAGSFCRAQEATWEFICEGHSNFVSAIKFFTTADRIQFVGPLDRSYGNACEAQKGGIVRLLIDSTNHSVELRVDPPPEPIGCPRNFAPVYAVAAEFGPLVEGNWVFWSSAYQFTNSFTVYPEPGPFQLRTIIENGMIRMEWPAVAYLRYELEASETLTNWQPAQVDYAFQGSVMSAIINLNQPYRFFRIKRSSILQTITPYPVDCGA